MTQIPSASTPAPRWLQQMATSPLVADSLSALVPTPPQLTFMGNRPPALEPGQTGIQGQVASDAPDAIRIWGDADPATQRAVVTHEFGHVLEAQTPPEGPFGETLLGVMVAQMGTPEAERSPHEYFADAFRDAFFSLSASGGLQPDAASQLLDDADATRPGTRRLAEYLLSLQLFAGHPLQAISMSAEEVEALDPTGSP
jgi:hypothetical protein